MIKANELRIGNLVNVPREDQSPFRIDAFEYLSNTYIKVAMTHPEFGDKMHPLTWYDEDLKPIPLTEEWLLKFGFKAVYFKDEKTINYFNTPNQTRGLWVKIRTTINGEKTFLIAINRFDDDFRNILYVNQLQNLFFCLTGSELTVA